MATMQELGSSQLACCCVLQPGLGLMNLAGPTHGPKLVYIFLAQNSGYFFHRRSVASSWHVELMVLFMFYFEDRRLAEFALNSCSLYREFRPEP